MHRPDGEDEALNGFDRGPKRFSLLSGPHSVWVDHLQPSTRLKPLLEKEFKELLAVDKFEFSENF